MGLRLCAYTYDITMRGHKSDVYKVLPTHTHAAVSMVSSYGGCYHSNSL